MGTCSSHEFEGHSSRRRHHMPNHPYQISLVKQADPMSRHYQNSVTRDNSKMTDSSQTLDEVMSPGTSLFKSAKALHRGRNFGHHPNVGPVIGKVKGDWDKNFTFEEISIKAKHHSFEQNHADDEEVCGIWRDIAKQYQRYKWQNAKMFKFDLEGCRQITDVTLETIGIELSRNFRGLRDLSLGFAECVKITDLGLETLLRTAFPHLSKLRKLELNFTKCVSITDHGLHFLAYNISRYLPGLDYLTLNFTECENISEHGLKHLSTKIPRRLTNLKKINLIFNHCEGVTDKDFIRIIGHQYNRLEEFNLSFQGCPELCDKVLDDFGSQISRHRVSLKSLILNLNSCDDISDEGLEYFQFHTSDHLRDLRQLSLDIGECHRITNKGIETLGRWMSVCLPNLESLTLNVDRCVQMNDKTLEIIADKICQLGRMKHLNLTFASIDAVNDKALQALGEKIGKNLVMLRSIKLVFASCRLITDDGLKSLGKRLRKLPGLQELTLNFSRCEKLTNLSLNLIEDAVSRYFCSLRKLTMDFRGCGKITYDMKDNLRYTWNYPSKLQLF